MYAFGTYPWTFRYARSLTLNLCPFLTKTRNPQNSKNSYFCIIFILRVWKIFSHSFDGRFAIIQGIKNGRWPRNPRVFEFLFWPFHVCVLLISWENKWFFKAPCFLIRNPQPTKQCNVFLALYFKEVTSPGKRQKRIEMQKIWLSVPKTVTFVFVIRPMLVKKLNHARTMKLIKKSSNIQ